MVRGEAGSHAGVADHTYKTGDQINSATISYPYFPLYSCMKIMSTPKTKILKKSSEIKRHQRPTLLAPSISQNLSRVEDKNLALITSL